MPNYQRTRQIHTILVALHPNLFSLENPVPFKIGIWADLCERWPEISPNLCAHLFRWLTVRRSYLRACVLGANRIGFDGPDGTVTEKQAVYAVEKLAWREADVAKREVAKIARLAAQ